MSCNINDININLIYSKIKNHNYLNLEELIISGFSVREYRKLYGIKENEYVDIYFDNAMFCKSFFDNSINSKNRQNICLDLAWCKFYCKDPTMGIAFNNSIFSNGFIDFSYSIFKNDLVFDECQFNNINFYFIGCYFSNSDFSFYKSHYVNCNLYIHSSNFINNEIIFNNSSFDNDVYYQFVNNNFINSKLYFDNINLTNSDYANGEFVFISNFVDNSIFEFINSSVDKIIFLDMTFPKITNLNVLNANYITIQQCINHDTIIIGNGGYNNITNICLKDTINLGQIIIKNQFNIKLFKNQKKLYYDPSIDSNHEYNYYECELNFPFALCDTSDEEKSMQFSILKTNESLRGNDKLNDEYYLLERKYKNKSKISNKQMLLNQLINNKKSFNNADYHKELIYIFIQIILASISFMCEKIILDLFCGEYATKPFKFLLSVVLIVTCFSFLYLYYGLNIVIIDNYSSFANALVYSIENFFPIGIIAYSNGIIHIITIIENIIGTIILSIFTISYTRKIIK